MTDDPILSVEDAAKLLGICPKTCYDWTRMDGFPCFKIGNCLRIPRDHLLEWAGNQALKRRGMDD